MKIQTQITLLGLGLTVATAGLIASVMFVKQTAMQQRIAGMTKDVDTLRGNVERDQVSLMESSISQQAMALLQSVEASDRRTSARLSHSLSIAQEQLAALGVIQFATETVAWSCVNQTTKEARELALPRVMAGTTWLGQNATTNEASPVVDFVRRNTRDYCTVFQRMNDVGDMLRVCTSVLKPDGSRAIGTYIPYAAPDGTPSPVLATVLAGKTYLGSARVYDQLHTATYEPIWDQAHQKVIGMLYVGVNTTDVNRQLRESLQQVAIGKTGYVFVLGGKGSQRGVYLVSKGGKRDGENIWEAKDSTGRFFIQSIVNQAMAATNGEPVLERYGWQNAGEPASRQKIAAAVYYAPMDWVIAASCYEDDFLESQKLVAQSTGAMLGTVQQTVADLKSALWWILGSALLVILCALVVSHLLARSLSRPLNAGVQFAHELAGGDLRGRMDASQKNEVGLLGRSLNEMVEQLRQTVQKLRRSSSSVASSSHSLSAVSAQVSSNSEETSAQANVVAAAAEQVSKNINTVATAAEELTATVREIAKQTTDATRVASEAVQLADATNVTISKLGVSSSQIGSVIKVITSIAEQTNLLALNATIEAARAGEAGKGFAVVANEVKELARQTSKATEEISSRITSIQDDTTNAVSAIGAIGKIISQINEIQTTIAGSVEEQAVTTNEISKNAAEAAGGAADIARNITSVSQAAQSSLQAATNTKDAASELARLAEELRSVVATFQVEEAEPSSPKPRLASPPAAGEARQTTMVAGPTAANGYRELKAHRN